MLDIEALKKIATDSVLITGLGAIIVNILITIFNFMWLKSRIQNERQYNLEIKFYERWVLKSQDIIIEFSAKIMSQFNELIKETQQAIQDSNPTRSLVEQHIEKIDKLYNELEKSTFFLISGYSPELSKEIEQLANDFYDKSVDIFSKLDRQTIPERRISTNMQALRAKFNHDIFSKIKKYRPN